MEEIYVTSPELPDLATYTKLLETVWATKQITNNGPFVQQLEAEISDYLGLNGIVLVNNGTNALTVALLSLNLTGEVITTPFTFAATASSIVAGGLTPVFCDIDPDTLNIDPAKIEAMVTPSTKAILATHCYGHPCAVNEIAKIANKYNLRVIYDASHAFGVRHNGRSLLTYGDIATVSLHATKVFSTVEGGMVVSQNLQETAKRVRNFGLSDTGQISDIGINAKMSELHAGFGLINLSSLDNQILQRQKIFAKYVDSLSGLSMLAIHCPPDSIKYNFSYLPVIFANEQLRNDVETRLKKNNIFPRRYFAPSLSTQPAFRSYRSDGCNVANDISNRILCLPLYSKLSLKNVDRICEVIRRGAK